MFGARFYEGLFHLLTFCALVLELPSTTMSLSIICHFSWILTLIIGALYEGIRGQQIFVAVIFSLHFSHVVFAQGAFSIIGTALWLFAAAAWTHSVVFIVKVGAFDF